MRILLNGEPLVIEAGTTVAALLHERQLGGKRLAVEVNEQVVSRSRYNAHPLQEGDRVEIVHAIGGG
jgi:sulfur carrier protein